MSEAKRAAYRTWFALFGTHNTPGGRLLCMGVAVLFLVFPVADLASGRLSTGVTILAPGGLAAFAAAYLRLFWILPRMADERRIEGFALLAAVAVLAVVLGAALGQEWLGLLVYLSVAAALTLPTRAALAGVVGATVAALAIVGGLDDVVLQTLLFGLLLIAVRRADGAGLGTGSDARPGRRPSGQRGTGSVPGARSPREGPSPPVGQLVDPRNLLSSLAMRTAPRRRPSSPGPTCSSPWPAPTGSRLGPSSALTSRPSTA